MKMLNIVHPINCFLQQAHSMGVASIIQTPFPASYHTGTHKFKLHMFAACCVFMCCPAGKQLNLLDTPGHSDFGEDTYVRKYGVSGTLETQWLDCMERCLSLAGLTEAVQTVQPGQ